MIIIIILLLLLVLFIKSCYYRSKKRKDYNYKNRCQYKSKAKIASVIPF